jgi:VanZ family protein
VLAYWLANAAYHLAFSRLVVSPLQTPLGALVPLHYTTEIMLATLALVFALLAWQARGGSRSALNLLAWGTLLLATVACDRWLLTTRVESIHYLQYGIISALLAWVLDPRRERWPLPEILLICFWLSVVDELNQYLYLTAREGTYFDFNDLLLNQLGSLAGLLFYYGFRPLPNPLPEGLPALRRALQAGSVLVIVLTLVMFVLGYFSLEPVEPVPPGGFLPGDGQWRLYWQREPGLYGNWLPTFSEGLYFVLSPLQGSVLLIATAVFCSPRLLARFS